MVNRSRSIVVLGRSSVILMFVLGVLSGAPNARAQSRLSDKDVEKMMDNLKNDAKQLRSECDSAVGKSTIHGTTQEKEFKTLLESFQKQSETMKDHFQSKKNVDADMKNVRDSADQIDKSLSSLQLGQKADAQWARVKSEVDTLSKAFGMEPLAAK